MSIIREVVLTLETIVTTSNLIVEVEAIEPYKESVPVPADNKNNTVPDFIRSGFTFQIKSVLKNTTGNSVPAIIRVPNENWKRSLSQHKEHYANGPSKSFKVNTYHTEVPSMKDADILFLSHFKNSFELTAKNSFESLASRKTIEEHI